MNPMALDGMADIQFRNVDLDIESKQPLDALVKDLGEKMIVLGHGQARGLHEAHFELAGAGGGDADSTIAIFCSLIEDLSENARRVWDSCCTRHFDIGFDSGDAPWSFQAILRPPTIQRVAQLGAAIVVTIYPRPEDAG